MKRLDWVDCLRGFGLLCVVVGHMQMPRSLITYIYCFHMPLFFFLSGYLYNQNLSWKWVLRKFDGLIVPYISYCLIGVLVVAFAKGESISHLLKLLYLGKGLGTEWFLLCLFMAEILGASIVRIVGRKWVVYGGIICALVGFGISIQNFEQVYMINTVFPATALWLFGFTFAQSGVLERVKRSLGLGGCVIGLGVLSMLAFVNGRVNINGNKYGNMVVFYIVSIAAIVMLMISFRRFIPVLRPLRIIGICSLPIMTMHVYIPMLMKRILQIVGIDVETSGIVIRGFSRVLFVMILAFIVYLISKRSKVLSGKGLILQRVLSANN